MMKMDDRGRAECQNWEKRDINVIFRKVFKSLNAKKGIVPSLTSLKRSKNVKKKNGRSSSQTNLFFREMMSSFSLEIRAIRPSVVFGTRRKAVLRGAAYAWVLDF